MKSRARRSDDYRERILLKIEKERARLANVLAGLDADDSKRARATAVMAHLTAWEHRMTRRIRGIAEGVPGPEELAIDDFNARVDAAAGKRTASAIRREFDESYPQVLNFIRHLPDHALASREVRLLIGYNTHGRYRWAIEKIRERLLGS